MSLIGEHYAVNRSIYKGLFGESVYHPGLRHYNDVSIMTLSV